MGRSNQHSAGDGPCSRGARRRDRRRLRALARRLAGVAFLSAIAVGLMAASSLAALPDGRSWELVSPATKHGSLVEPNGLGIGAPFGGLTVASETGGAVTYVANSPVTSEPEGNRATEGNQVLAARSSEEWRSKDIVTRNLTGEGDPAGEPQEYRAFSPDLSLALVVPFGRPANPLQQPPLADVPEGTSEERGIYLRHNSTPCNAAPPAVPAPAPCYEPLVNSEDDTAGLPFGGKLRYLGSSPDLNHVVFESSVALLQGVPEEGLYEWNAAPGEGGGQLQLISRVPKRQAKNPVIEPQLGNNLLEVRHSVRNAVSADGSRIFWTASVNPEKEELRSLYMRNTRTQTTMQIESKQKEAGESPRPFADESARYQTASSDGSRVFFTDTKKLMPDSVLKGSGEEHPADLYVCEIEEANENADVCPKLVDLTGTGHGFGGGGDVVGAVIGTSEDGSTVYFVANGADKNATEHGATTGNCPNPTHSGLVPPGAQCNVYVAHESGGEWEEPKLVTVLSANDQPDWAGPAADFLTTLSSRVSPDGEYLAFMSELPLTGYDNRDTNPAANEARDEEVFLYHASNGSIVCASCNPNPAQRPTGVFDTLESGEGAGLVVDPLRAVWPERWLAASIPSWTILDPHDAPYQSHYLLNNGRLYFNSADSLVPADTNTRTETIPPPEVEGVRTGPGVKTTVGVEDVYQYEPEGVGSCSGAPGGCVSLLSSGDSEHESAFLDANENRTDQSTSGNDVFFLTSQPLVSSDIDTVADIYDARVCSDASPCITPPSSPPEQCGSEASCRANTGGTPGFNATASEASLGTPSVSRVQTLPSKTSVKPKPKPLTRKQKLKRALTACRKAHKHNKHKLKACEKQAQKKYGTHTKHKAAKK